MCGRFSEHLKRMNDWAELLSEWPEQPNDATARRNIAPTQNVWVLRDGPLSTMRWGLVPAWSDTPAPKYATFNARFEDVTTKPAFRTAWKQSRRCLIPAGGYYEWKTENSVRQPWFIHREDHGPLMMGGLWEAWVDPDSGESVHSCTILTRAAVSNLAELHHRMPVLVQAEQAESWLNGDTDDGSAIATNCSADGLRWHAVSRNVNNARNESPELTLPKPA